MGDLVFLPGITPSDIDPPGPNLCALQKIGMVMEKVASGELRSFVLVGEMADGGTCEYASTCEGDLHVLDSILGAAQRGVQGMIDTGRDGRDIEGLV